MPAPLLFQPPLLFETSLFASLIGCNAVDYVGVHVQHLKDAVKDVRLYHQRVASLEARQNGPRHFRGASKIHLL
jgi:hypothetical protein